MDRNSEQKIQSLLDTRTEENIDLAFSLLQNLKVSEKFALRIAFHHPIKCLEYEVALDQIAAIEEINCAFSKIDYLPDNLGHFKKLKRFELECNRIKKIPKSIGDLKNLEYISFFDCDPAVEYIDPAIGQLKNLKELLLGVNDIKELPETLFDCTNLQYLDIQENPITTLSEKIIQLQKLSWIDLSWTELQTLPQNIGKLEQLKAILLDGFKQEEELNKLAGLKNLERLSLFDCGLTRFPGFISKLPELRRLDLTSNSIRKIPDEIVHLKKLEIMSITGLPDTEVAKIKTLLPAVKLYYNTIPQTSIIYSDGN
jgi:leucine-rich repeat protein SHOC2